MKNKNSIWVLLLCSTIYAQEYRGKVVSIADGDAFALLTGDKQQIKVRLSGIDTSERAQPFGTWANQALPDLIFAKEVWSNPGRNRPLWTAGCHVTGSLFRTVWPGFIGNIWRILPCYRMSRKQNRLRKVCEVYQVPNRCHLGNREKGKELPLLKSLL